MDKATERQDFDSPWKEALDYYFPSFMAFFFSDIHAAIDWTRKYEFLDKEFQKITRNAEQSRRYVDKLVKVFLAEGQETWLLIHVEIQGQADADFAERMFVYHYRILDRYKKETVSLGVLSDPDQNFHPSRYVRERFGCRVEFTFPTVKVLDYGNNWSELERSDNPFAMVVMAHLKAQEINVRDGEERKRWKLRLIRLLYDRGYERGDVLELFRFIDWLLILPPELEKTFTEELHIIEEEKKMAYVTSVERVGIEKGIEQGVEQGSLQEARITLLEALTIRFGTNPVEVVETVEHIAEYDVLKQLFRQAIQCSGMKEFMVRLDEV